MQRVAAIGLADEIQRGETLPQPLTVAPPAGVTVHVGVAAGSSPVTVKSGCRDVPSVSVAVTDGVAGLAVSKSYVELAAALVWAPWLWVTLNV